VKRYAFPGGDQRIWSPECQQYPPTPDGWQVKPGSSAVPPVIDRKIAGACRGDLICLLQSSAGWLSCCRTCSMTGAQALVAAVDNEAWLPSGQAPIASGWRAST
jgi:hypothetical protein